MLEPSAKLKQALSHVEAPWDAARSERTLSALPAGRRRRQLRRSVGSLVLLGASIGCALWWMPADSQTSTAPIAHASRANAVVHEAEASSAAAATPVQGPGTSPLGRQLELQDGSRIVLLDAPTDVVVEESSPQLMALRLTAGRARFAVSQRPERLFRVRTANVTVEVLGTVFELSQAGDKTRVRVEHGKVAVMWQQQRALLRAGEEGWFPPALPEAPKPKRPARTGPQRGPAPLAADDWREHAERGDFNTAFPLLPPVATLASMPVSELLLAADAARLSGHPSQAIPFLERVVEAHGEDARAPLAAFTLGSLLMHQLGMPREAEGAYAKARALTRGGALAQDALARQVEAAHRAGDDGRARALAVEYLRQYPEGRRVDAVRRFGGL